MDVEMELRNAGSNSCSAKNKKKKRNKKNKALCDSISANDEGPSLMQDVVLEKDLSTANVSSSCSGLVEDQPNSNMNSSADKNRRKRERRKMRKVALKAVNVDVDLQVASEMKPDHIGKEVLVDVRTKPMLEKDACVESTGNIGSSSGLIEVQSNSDLNITENKKRKREKKKRRTAQKADNTDDMTMKTVVSETALVEVQVHEDVSKEMDSIATTSFETGAAVDTNTKTNLITNLSRSQKKKLKRRKKKQAQNSVGHDDIDHIHPEDNALTKNAVVEKVTSLLSSANMCSEKQPNGHISVCLGKNEVKGLNYGHNESENNSTGNGHMGNGKLYEERDLKFAPAAAELDLTKVKEDLLVSEKQSNYSNLNITENKKKKKRAEKKRLEALKAVNKVGHLQDVVSETKPDPSKIEGPINMSTKLVSEKQINCSNLDIAENKKKRKRAEKKRREALKAVNKDGDLQEVVSETKPDRCKIEGPVDMSTKLVSHKDSCVESTGKISSSSGLTEVQSNSDLNISENKKRKKQKKEKYKALKADNKNVDLQEKVSQTKAVAFRIEGPVGVSIKPVTEKDSYVESTGNISSLSGLIEVHSNSNLNISDNKKRKKEKKKRGKAPKADTDVDIQVVASETKTAPIKVEGPVDASIRMVAETAPVEVEVPDDLSKEMDSIATSVEIEAAIDTNMKINSITNLSRSQKKKLNRREKKQTQNSLGHDDIDHVHPEDNAIMRSTVLKEDTSLLSSANMCQEKQPNGHISLCLEKDEVKELNDVHNESKNNSTGYRHMGNGKHYEKKDLKFAPAAAELDVTGVKYDLLVPEKQSNYSKIEDTSSLEKHDFPAKSVNTDRGKKTVKTHSGKKRIEPSDFEEKTSDSIKEIGTELDSFGTLEAALVLAGFSENKLAIDENLSGPKEKTSDSISHLGVTKIDVVDDTDKEDNLLQKSHPSPERACIGHCKKKLLVLDVNGLLADIVQYPPKSGYKPHRVMSKKAVFKRPYCDDFLQFCFERFNIGVWSSRIRRNVDAVVKFLIGDLRSNLLFMWDASHCTKTGLNTVENKNKPLVLKELKKLWDRLEPNLPWKKGEYNETNTLLLDDSPYKALRNPAHTAIFPFSYQYKDAKDSSLGPGGDLRVYLEGLAAAENVQEYIKQNPFGQQAITESNPFWDFYSKIIDTDGSQPHDTSTISSVAVNNVVSRMPLENTSETGFGSKVTLHQPASASETCDNNTVTPMDIRCS